MHLGEERAEGCVVADVWETPDLGKALDRCEPVSRAAAILAANTARDFRAAAAEATGSTAHAMSPHVIF